MTGTELNCDVNKLGTV